MVSRNQNRDIFIFCLTDENWVLTAAHCLSEDYGPELVVTAGAHDNSKADQKEWEEESRQTRKTFHCCFSVKNLEN